MTRREWAFYLVTSAITVGVVYLLTTENDADLRMLRATSRLCQGTARVVGTWGLQTERLYLRLLEQNRMI